MKDWKFMLLLILAGLAFIAASLFGETDADMPYTFTTTNALRFTASERLFEVKNEGKNIFGVRGSTHPSAVWFDGTNELSSAILATNVLTEWITVEDHRPKSEPTTLESLTNQTVIHDLLMRYDSVKQVGFLVTNQVLRVIHNNVTNDVHLATLYRDEWPTQKRTLSIPR